MIKLHSKTLDLCSMLENWSVSHVMREKNTEADLLSKEGLEKKKKLRNENNIL